MIIKDVQLIRGKSRTVLSAKCKIRKIGWDTVYFRVDSKHSGYVADDASPFAAALLLPAMKQGEDLIVKGSISRQLYAGMQDIMGEVVKWDLGLKRIKIQADSLTDDQYKPRKTAAFFSGGVDSFYTYLKHTDGADKNGRLDSIIFVNNGNDINPKNQKLWAATLRNLEAIATAGGVELIVAQSNVNSLELLNPILSWDYIHGACLAATGLFLRADLSRIYIASTHSTEEQIPYGSNLALDNHWSTESLEFIHDGSEVTRLDKVVTRVGKSPIALKYLRVCYANKNGAYNCGQCDKCLRTMVNLYIAGGLHKAQTFPRKLDLKRVAATPTIIGENLQIFHNENLAALKQRNLNPKLQQAIAQSLALTKSLKPSTTVDKIKRQIAYLDHAYAKGHLLQAYDRLLGQKFS